MAHNFRMPASFPARWRYLIADGSPLYVSKAGAPGNLGGPDAPYSNLTFENLRDTSRPVKVIGAGQYVYITDPVKNNYNYESQLIVGDGKVILSGESSPLFASPFQMFVLYNLEIKDYEYIFKHENQAQALSVIQCILRNGKIDSLRGGTNSTTNHLVDCIFINVVTEGVYFAPYSTDPTKQLYGNLFINSPGNAEANQCHFVACYFDATSVWRWTSGWLPKNCNIRGALYVDQVLYGSLAEAAVAHPNLLAFGNINQDPGFNKPDAEDYTLRINSPHLNTGIGPSHLRYANSFYVEMTGGASPGDTVTAQNCVLRSTANAFYTVPVLETNGLQWNNQGGLSIRANSNGNYEGYILFDKIRVSDVPQKILRWRLAAGLNFNSDYPGAEPSGNQLSANPEVFNNNVPDYSNSSSGAAGRNPNRLTEQFRWSNNASPGVTSSDSSDWVTGNTYLEFEIDGQPEYNSVPLRGNGDPNFDPTQVQPVVARWIQPRFKLRNNYYSK